MDTVIFEEMKEEYLTEVLEIYNYYVINSTATFHLHALSEDEMRELVFFNTPIYKTFIIRSSDIIIGYVILNQHKKREAYDITAEIAIYLKPDFTGKGTGSQAVKFIEDIAKQQNLHVLVATICGDNTESIKLFEKNGYTKCAHYKEVGKKFGQFLDLVAYQKIIS